MAYPRPAGAGVPVPVPDRRSTGRRHAGAPDLPAKLRRWWDTDGLQELCVRFLGVQRRLLDRAGGTG